jgi:hypothetical protein
MRYDKAAVRAAVDHMGLAPRSQLFVQLWLEGWTGKDLPQAGSFPCAREQELESLIMVTLLEPGVSAQVTYMGQTLQRAAGLDVTGMDWISLAPPELRGERMRRANAIGAGAILRTTRQVAMDSRTPYFFECVSVPLHPDAEGRVPLVHFADWAPPGENPAIVYDMRSVVPEVAEILPLTADEGTLAAAERTRQQEVRTKVISRAAIRFMLGLLDDMAQVPEELKLDPIDYIVAVAVDLFNVSHIDDDPALSRRYASQVEPDSMRRGVSLAEIAQATNLPLEAARWRVSHLIQIGVLQRRKDGIILSSTNPYRIGVRRDLMHRHAQLVERLMRDLRARGISLG